MSLYFPARGPLISPWPRSWPPVCIYRPWSPVCIYRSWPPVCIYRPWPPICIYQLSNLYLPALAPNLNLPALAQICIYQPCPSTCLYRPWPETLYLPPVVPKLYLPTLVPICIYQSRSDFTTTTTATSTITTTTANTTTCTTTTTIATTTTINNDNKRYLHSKIRIKWHLKGIWWKSLVLFSRFVDIIANVFLVREAAVIFKEVGHWLFLKWMQTIAASIKMNKSRAIEKVSLVDFNSEVCEMSLNR